MKKLLIHSLLKTDGVLYMSRALQLITILTWQSKRIERWISRIVAPRDLEKFISKPVEWRLPTLPTTTVENFSSYATRSRPGHTALVQLCLFRAVARVAARQSGSGAGGHCRRRANRGRFQIRFVKFWLI